MSCRAGGEFKPPASTRAASTRAASTRAASTRAASTRAAATRTRAALRRAALPDLLPAKLLHDARELCKVLILEAFEEVNLPQRGDELRLVELELIGQTILKLAAEGALKVCASDAHRVQPPRGGTNPRISHLVLEQAPLAKVAAFAYRRQLLVRDSSMRPLSKLTLRVACWQRSGAPCGSGRELELSWNPDHAPQSARGFPPPRAAPPPRPR